MGNNKCILVFAALIFFSFAAEARITEIMYNPPGNDNNQEYIEVIFDFAMSMEKWSVADLKSSDVLVLIGGGGNSEINLIVEEGYDFQGLDLENTSVYSAGKTIGDNLNNAGDSVYVYDENGTEIASASYDDSFGNNNGMAVCFFENETAYECEPSPGEENEFNSGDPGNGTGGDDNGTESNETLEENVTVYKTEDGYLSIDYVKYPKDEKCGHLKVGVVFWNTLNRKEDVVAYIREIDVHTSLKVNPNKGQMVELPVATCDGSSERVRGEYALVVEGFGEKDMMIIELEGFDDGLEVFEAVAVEEEIESNINEESGVNHSFEAVEEVYQEKSSENKKKWLSKTTIWLLCLIGGLVGYYIMFRW